MRRSACEEAKRWLDQARDDMKWARSLSEEGGYHIACFLSQQIAEKAIKAFLYAQGEFPVVGHSVAALAEKAGRYNDAIGRRARTWAILDGYYIPTRYPNGLPDSIPSKVYGPEAAVQAVNLAEDVVSTIASILDL